MMKNHRYKYKNNPIKRFFYRAALFTHINYTYDFKYKYFHFVTSFIDTCLVVFLLLFRRPVIRLINRVVYPLLDYLFSVLLIIKKNKSSLLFIYLVNFTSNTSVPFYKFVFRWILSLSKAIVSNINYTYTSYGNFRQKFILQVASEHYGYKDFLISPLALKKVSDVFNGLLSNMEKEVLDLKIIERSIEGLRAHPNIGGLFLTSLQRVPFYNLLIFLLKRIVNILFILFSFLITSFVVLFYKLVLNNTLYLFTYILDLTSILNRLYLLNRFKRKINKRKFNVKYFFYPFSYVVAITTKFVISFNYKSAVDSFFKFVYFMIEHNGNLFYDRGNYWSNVKKLEKFYRFQASLASKKDIVDNFPGRNFDYLMEQGKAGPFNWDYDSIVDSEFDPFIYLDNHRYYKETDVEDIVSYLSYKYFVFGLFLNNFLRIPFLLLTLVVNEGAVIRGVILGRFKQAVQWAGQFDNEMMRRTSNPFLKAQFDTWEFWAPTNTVMWTMRWKVIVGFVLAVFFVENGFIYDGFCFPFNKEVIMISGLTWSPMLTTGFWIGMFASLYAYERLFGNEADNVVANYTNYVEDFEKKDFISMMDYKFFIFFNLVLSTYYTSYILYVNSTLHFDRIEEIKRIKKVFQNRNTVCDTVSLNPLSEVSGDFMAEFVFTAKLIIFGFLRPITYIFL